MVAEKKKKSDDVFRLHLKSAVPALVLGMVLGGAGLRTLAIYVPGLGTVLEEQQKQMCGETVNAIILDYTRKMTELEKRVAALEATLKAHGIDF